MKKITSSVFAALATLGLAIASAPAAHALPPGGAGPDTPGTDATLSPSTVEACDVIRWSVTGFPANQTVHVKINDGVGFGDTTVQGTGVMATAQANGSGQANGTVRIPCDLAPGSHWLRFLASEEVTNANGEYTGVKGYTNRSSNFTVKAKANSGGNSGNSGTGGNSGNSGNNAASGNSGTGGNSGAANNARANANAASVAGGGNANSNSANTGGAQRTVVRRTGGTTNGTAGGNTAGGAAHGNAANSGNTAGNNANTGGENNKNNKNNKTTGGNGNNANGNNVNGNGTEEVILADDATTSDGQQIIATSADGDYITRDDATVVGRWAGAAILLVGFAGIGAYLWVNRRRTQNNNDYSNGEY